MEFWRAYQPYLNNLGIDVGAKINRLHTPVKQVHNFHNMDLLAGTQAMGHCHEQYIDEGGEVPH